ncbi:MAG: protein translocase subunit SecF [Tissierellia bacterium]|nr:protein translocase subunit SecF [Tissierellia bacterium]
MDFIKYRKISFAFSTIYIIIGLALILVRGLNLDIDFTSGTMFEILSENFISDEDIRKITDDIDAQMHINRLGENNSTILLKTAKNLSTEELNVVKAKFEESYGIKSEMITSRTIEASMGSEIRNKAILATLISIVGILIYVSLRFKLDYGIAAIVALFHDIIFMVASYSIFNIPINSSFIAAILTVLGYSINDTIVIFDRIRENLKLYPNKTTYDIVNTSVKQSMARTINTSLTTLTAIVILYIFGVNEVRVLSLPLMIGVVIGTYSTIFIASPLWYMIRSKKEEAK